MILVFLLTMKTTTLRHILFTMLTTVMCFGFSSYVVLSQFNVAKEITISSVEDETTEASDKSVNELNTFFIHQDISTNKTLILSSRMDYPIQQEQLPDFHIMINTPPPDLA